eukprot:scaffold130748_cov41-Tisochrysis_lutea.AAC.2
MIHFAVDGNVMQKRWKAHSKRICAHRLKVSMAERPREEARHRRDVGGRALHHDDVLAQLGELRDEGDGGRTRPDDHHSLARELDFLRPELWVYDLTSRGDKLVPAWEARVERLVVVVVANAGYEEAALNLLWHLVVSDEHVNRPRFGLGGPGLRDDLVLVPDPARDVVLVRRLADVIADVPALCEVLVGVERLEAVSIINHWRVGADPRILEDVPGASTRTTHLEDHIILLRAHVLQVVSTGDPRKAGADDDDVKLLLWDGVGLLRHGRRRVGAAWSCKRDG